MRYLDIECEMIKQQLLLVVATAAEEIDISLQYAVRIMTAIFLPNGENSFSV